MQYNTALGFLLSGLGLLGLILNKPKMAQICGSIVSFLGILTLIEYSFDINLGMDEFFVQHNILVGTSHPGRMAPNTALCFMLSGLALVLTCANMPREIPTLISILVLSLGFIALAGYIIDLESAYGWGSLTRMALHTTAGFLILGSGLVSYTWQSSMSQNRLPIITGLVILTLTMTLWQALATRDKQQIQDTIEQITITVRDKLTFDLNAQALALKRMGNRWEQQKPTYSIWESDANAYVQDMPNLQAVEWVDKTFIVRWVIPLKGNEAAINLNLAFEEKRKQALLIAQNKTDITFTDPIDLIQGNKGFLVYIPLFPNGQFDGFILGVYNINTLINHTINPNILANYHIMLSLHDSIFYSSSDTEISEKRWLHNTVLTSNNLNWNIQVYPKNIWQLSSFVPELALGVGLFISVLCSISIFYAQKSLTRTHQLNLVNTQLQENETRFRTLTSNAPVGIYQTDEQGKCLFVNERWGAFTGRTTEESVGNSWTNAIHPDDKEDVLGAWRWATDTNLEFKKEYRFLKPSGQIVWVSGNAIQLTDKNEETIGYIGTIADITNQKLAEEALQLNRHELNRQVDTQTALIEINRAVQLVRHPDDLKNVTEVCAEQLKRLGIDFYSFSINHLIDDEKMRFEIHTIKNTQEYQKEVISRPGIYNEFKNGNIVHRKDLLDPQYQVGLPEKYLKNHTLNGVLDIRTILQIPFTKGTLTLRHEHPNAFSDDHVSLIQNITETLAVGITRVEDLIQLEQSRLELTQHAHNLTRTNEELEQFAYVASHDLQEPLRVINNYLQLLERRHLAHLNEQAQSYIHRVINSATRMKTLIQDLLAYSRISTHTEPLKTISIDPILQQIKEDLEISIQETNAVITHDPLPQIDADESQMTQLLLNLVSNAIKYRSEQPPQIHISTSQTPTHWQFGISDNGQGIDPEFFDRIFIIFQRLHGRDEYPGTGIGLAICRKIVERHKGTIWVESNPEQGSTFHFTIAKSITSS